MLRSDIRAAIEKATATNGRAKKRDILEALKKARPEDYKRDQQRYADRALMREIGSVMRELPPPPDPDDNDPGPAQLSLLDLPGDPAPSFLCARAKDGEEEAVAFLAVKPRDFDSALKLRMDNIHRATHGFNDLYMKRDFLAPYMPGAEDTVAIAFARKADIDAAEADARAKAKQAAPQPRPSDDSHPGLAA